MRTRRFGTKMEEVRQAARIHGGLLRLGVAALGVRLSRLPIPTRRLRLLVYNAIYGGKYAALNQAEFERPMHEYRSLNALFTRGVRPELRPIPAAADALLCPCDGRVQDVGDLAADRILTVKGIAYTLDALLPGVDGTPLRDGKFAIVFLSPADCHRVFCPAEAIVEEVIHVPGSRLLVHPPYQRPEYPVFSLNERVIIRLRTVHGVCVLVLVAGWGVGNITLRFDPTFRPRPRTATRKRYEQPLVAARADWLATFELGSTVIVLTEGGRGTCARVTRDEKLHYGQPLFAFPTEGGGV